MKIISIDDFIEAESASNEGRIDALEENLETTRKAFNKAVEEFNFLSFGIPYIYIQTDTDLDDNCIEINADKNIINSSRLLYVLPLETYQEVNEDETELEPLSLKIGDKKLKIKKESGDGTLKDVEIGDIQPNRLAIFRFSPFDKTTAVLLNSPVHGDISINSITANKIVTNELKKQKPDHTQVDYVTEDRLTEEREDIDEKYTKIHIGTKPPDEAFQDTAIGNGEIYIQAVDFED